MMYFDFYSHESETALLDAIGVTRDADVHPWIHLRSTFDVYEGLIAFGLGHTACYSANLFKNICDQQDLWHKDPYNCLGHFYYGPKDMGHRTGYSIRVYIQNPIEPAPTLIWDFALQIWIPHAQFPKYGINSTGGYY
jgi:hypothetical protein